VAADFGSAGFQPALVFPDRWSLIALTARRETTDYKLLTTDDPSACPAEQVGDAELSLESAETNPPEHS
jgi:hypothetical protein